MKQKKILILSFVLTAILLGCGQENNQPAQNQGQMPMNQNSYTPPTQNQQTSQTYFSISGNYTGTISAPEGNQNYTLNVSVPNGSNFPSFNFTSQGILGNLQFSGVLGLLGNPYAYYGYAVATFDSNVINPTKGSPLAYLTSPYNNSIGAAFAVRLNLVMQPVYGGGQQQQQQQQQQIVGFNVVTQYSTISFQDCTFSGGVSGCANKVSGVNLTLTGKN